MMFHTRTDYAHQLLIPFLKNTESMMNEVISSLDSNAGCKIHPAIDLGFPHDVIRIAGGFATGCYIEWDVNRPFIPIDTTVNIDTSSVFYLNEDISDSISMDSFEILMKQMEDSSYIFNFHKGNHFISFGYCRSSNKPVLILHSNEKEFKYQFNGLMPTVNNWFYSDIKTYKSNDRYLRYLIDKPAELFIDIAKSLEDYNIIRHRFIAHMLTKGKTFITDQVDHHHYFMPNRQSVAIGCFPVKPETVVPIFSKVGKEIVLFKTFGGGKNTIDSIHHNPDLLLVPHGWGKTCKDGTTFQIEGDSFILSGKKYENKPLVSLGKDESLFIRNFTTDDRDENSFYNQISKHCPGTIEELIIQKVSYSKYGCLFHE